MINADNFSSIWTAGHCVHGGQGGTWFSNFLFRPAYPYPSPFIFPFLAWSWKYVATTLGWALDGDWAYDIAAIALWPNSLGRIADRVGYQGYKFNWGVYAWNIHSFGYPQNAVPDRPEMDGQRLYYCTGTTWAVSSLQLGFNCDMFHGASGGPWLDDLQTARGWGYIISVNSWHSFTTDEWNSAYHGDAAINVRNLIKIQ